MRFGQWNQRGQRWGVAFSAVLLVAAVVCGSVPVGAAPPGTGSISGRVVDGDGNPISGICVKVEKGVDVHSDGSGAYVITGLDAGEYKVGFTDCNAQPQFVEQWYLGHTAPDAAAAVSVADDTNTALPDITLATGVVVAGTVTDPDGIPISGISVSVNPAEPGPASTGAMTGSDGTYATVPLTPGGYKVEFFDKGPNPEWASQFWNQQYSWDTADTLNLTLGDGPTHAGVDGHLTAGATVTGTVRGPDGNPLSGICVGANVMHDGSAGQIADATTGPVGEYTIGGLPATDLRIQFRDCQHGPYLDQWYDGQAGSNVSTPVLVSSGETRTGIDAALSEGVAVSGLVRDANGSPIANIGVNVNPTGEGVSGWGQTDGAGRYTTNALPPGTYRVRFSDPDQPPTWATQYWNAKLGENRATTLTLAVADGSVHEGVNATLALGATIKGTVSASSGAPVDRICVSAQIAADDGTEWLAGTATASDGTYVITGLPATGVLIQFQDCNDVGPFIEQWWDHQPDFATAVAIVLAPGATRSGINATLAAASEITGTVTDRAGHPLQGICAQATTDTFVGGIAGTNEHGVYAINLDRPGSYRVQFVDCSGTPRYAGEWWDNQATAADAQVITIGVGEVVGHVDAALARGATGTISGTVTNLHGVPMTTACVLAFLPDKFALFAPVNPDGTYTIPDVPSGTYALAFLGCNGGDPNATVRDPQSSVTSYQAVWWKGALVGLGEGQSPDPIAQGATFVTVKPGQDRSGYDWCFGCTAIVITGVTPGAGSLTVAFTTPGLLPSGVQSLAVTPAAEGFSYTVTCTSSSGVTGTATGTSSPITVTGLTDGAAYTCTVTASDGTVTVASSSAAAAVTSASVPTEGTIPVVVPVPGASTARATTPSSGGITAAMARTGSDSALQARFGAALLALGLALVFVTRSRRSPQDAPLN